jgi:glycosyltransferase involved in cell wall biosynthesis
MPERPVIVCFAGDAWDGNPHSRHHLMHVLVRDYDVLFVEGLPMRGPMAADRTELRRIWRKLRAPVGLREVEPRLFALRPPPVPPSGRAGRALQLRGARAAIGWAARRARLAGPRISWFSLPNVAPLRGEVGDRASLLYYQDRYDAFTGVDGERLRRHLASLAAGCDVTVATSEPLAGDLRALGAQPVVVPHGVDVARFAAGGPEPADLAGLERPLAGFVGLLDDYVDVAALLATADALDPGTVVLVGGENVDTRELAAHPRVRLLGRRPYETMPAYLAAFDVCLVPFARSALTEGVNPIKLREYLAAGRPVVATPLPAVREYAEVVRLADDPASFAAAVREEVAGAHDPDLVARRRAAVTADSWEAAAERIAVLLAAAQARAGLTVR